MSILKVRRKKERERREALSTAPQPYSATPSGVPSGYEQLFAANPYRNQVASGGIFGIGKHKEQEQINMNAREYDANIMALIQQNQYNSAQEQASRLKDAGINPDLAGGVSPGEAAEAGIGQSGIDFVNPAEQVSSFLDNMLNIAALGMSFSQQGFDNGLALVDAAHQFAMQFPDSYLDITPPGSGLAPVLVRNGITGKSIADTIPGLSTQQRVKFAKTFERSRGSMGAILGKAQTRKELADILNSPNVAFPEQSQRIIGLGLQIQEIGLKHELQAKVKLAEYSKQIAEQQASNAVSHEQTKSLQEEAMQASANAVKATAAAQEAEAVVRKETAEATSGQEVGQSITADAIARQQEAIVRGEEAKAAKEQLEVIAKAEEEGVFDGTLVTDILKFRVGSDNKKRWDDLWNTYHKRRNAKRNEKRRYGSSSGSSVSVSVPGVGNVKLD